MASYYQLQQYELEAIQAKLPAEFAELKDTYPLSVAAAATSWDLPAYPKGYKPRIIELNYTEDDDFSSPHVVIEEGAIVYFDSQAFDVADGTLGISLDEEEPAYVRISDLILLNRMEEVILPKIAIPDTSLWLRFNLPSFFSIA